MEKLGAWIVNSLPQYLAKCLWQEGQTLVNSKRCLVISCPCHLSFQSGSSHLDISWWQLKFLFQLCHLGTRGLWASSTTSLNLSLFIKWIHVYFLDGGVHTCLCKCRWIWSTEADVKCLPQPLSTLLFWRQSLSLLLNVTDWLACQWVLEIILSLPPPQMLRDCAKCHQACPLYRSWGIKTQVLKCFKDWIISPAPKLYFIVELIFLIDKIWVENAHQSGSDPIFRVLF